MSVRDEVLNHLVEVMRAAEDEGLDAISVAEAAFPGTPESVLGEAFVELGERRAEAWWKSVEKTIDGEIIKLALRTSDSRKTGHPVEEPDGGTK